MRYFQCDKCKKQFQNELEQMTWKDGGIEKAVDLCSPCKDIVKKDLNDYKKSVLNPIYNSI